MNFTTPK